MSDPALRLDELLAWTGDERDKWRRWFETRDTALGLAVQSDGRFPTVGTLVDHIFLVEARHLARLKGAPVPERSGVAPHDRTALFEYGARVREDLRTWLPSLSDEDAGAVRSITVQSGTYRLTPRKLLLHIALHETRHWAQIALVVRQAGLVPPGEHDLLFSRALD